MKGNRRMEKVFETKSDRYVDLVLKDGSGVTIELPDLSFMDKKA